MNVIVANNNNSTIDVVEQTADLINQFSFTGTQIHCYFTCHRQLWYFSNHIQMEHNSDYVYLGKILHEEAYNREKKEIEIDGKIKIDFFQKDAVISEVKKSPSSEESHIWQLKYYLYYLKTKKMIENVTGKIHYPKLKQTIDVFLEDNDAEQIENIMAQIKKILQNDKPPVLERMKICNKCSYYELCFI